MSGGPTSFLPLFVVLLCCTLSLAQNPCNPNPCKNGGTCSPVSPGDFSCDCSLTGFSGPTCSQQIYCHITTEGNAFWPQAKALTNSYGICEAGYIGQPFRLCQRAGNFAGINNPCRPDNLTCYEDVYNNAFWPATSIGKNSTGICLPGFSSAAGSVRKCKTDGTWESSVQDHCLRNFCPQDNSGGGAWPITPSLSTVSFVCPTGLGMLNRTCGKDGLWEDVVGVCGDTSSVPCPPQTYARAQWNFTEPGDTAQGNCVLGWSGTPTRFCRFDGFWETLVRSHCQRNICLEDVSAGFTWATSSSMVSLRLICPGGNGSVVRTCKANGTWAGVVGACGGVSVLPCTAEEYGGAFWPATNRGDTAVGECPTGSGGVVSRVCGFDGAWAEPQGSC